MAQTIVTVPDDLLYLVCVKLLRNGESSTEVTRWLKANGYPKAKREWPRQLLVEAFRRGLLQLANRENFELGSKIATRADVVCRVAAIDDADPAAFENVAELAADQALKLVRQVHEAGQDMEPPLDEVHVGFSAGAASNAFAAHLARKLRAEQSLPRLVLHTLTSGFVVNNPASAPVVSLSQFTAIEPRPEYVVLFTAPLVSTREAAKLPQQPLTRDAFKAAKDLDIVVTSVSVADHEHSLFKFAVAQDDPSNSERHLDRLRGRGWQGDIMWRPYDQDGRPIDSEVEPVSVVGFGDLVRLANTPNKHVICIAGPCEECRRDKVSAVLPLLKAKHRGRPFSHLVATQSTARKICEALDW